MPIEYSIVTGYFYKNGKRVGGQAVEDWAKEKREELHGQYANHT